MGRVFRFLTVTIILLIMAGGIYLTDHNMRQLQGREQAHLSIDRKALFFYVKKVNEQFHTKSGVLHTWCDSVLETSADLISSAQEMIEKRLTGKP